MLKGEIVLTNSDEGSVEAFSAWCQDLAARKARNAVPGEPAAPSLNGIHVSSADLLEAFQKAHPKFDGDREALEAFVQNYGPGLEVDKERWDSVLNA
jgi:hypothetical protein